MGRVECDLANLFFARIRNRLLINNENWLSIFCGETGSGKSYSAMSMAKAISPRFTSKNIVFTAEQFIEKIKDRKNLQKGDIIIFDEAGVGMPARDWYSVQNKLFGAILQTFRVLNIGVIFTTPNLSYIDVQARCLFHNYFETEYKDKKNMIAYSKCFDIQHNSMKGKTYYKKPIMQIDSQYIKMDYLGLPLPDKDLIEGYEPIKQKYTHGLIDNAYEVIQQLNEKPKEKKEKNIGKIQEDIIKNKDKYLKEYNKRQFIDTDLIKHDFELSLSEAKSIKKRVEETIL